MFILHFDQCGNDLFNLIYLCRASISALYINPGIALPGHAVNVMTAAVQTRWAEPARTNCYQLSESDAVLPLLQIFNGTPDSFHACILF